MSLDIDMLTKIKRELSFATMDLATPSFHVPVDTANHIETHLQTIRKLLKLDNTT